MEAWKIYYHTLLEDEKTEEEEIIPLEEELILERNPCEEPVQNGATMEELAQTIQKMKNRGHDEITVEMIRAFGLKKLLKLVNDVRVEKMPPKNWKVGIICQIYKKGDSQQCTNCRGITLRRQYWKANSERE